MVLSRVTVVVTGRTEVKLGSEWSGTSSWMTGSGREEFVREGR